MNIATITNRTKHRVYPLKRINLIDKIMKKIRDTFQKHKCTASEHDADERRPIR